jgi:hypothetical protein
VSKSTDRRPPPGVDVNIPSAARIYDYSLGGAHNFAADRAAAHELFEAYPDAPLVGRANRAFLQRAVRFCHQRGITQFLDLGSGIPTVGNVHESAHALDPGARVVYVDNEPVAVTHTQQLLESVRNTAIVQADIRDVDAVLTAPQTRALLDFSQPVALMMVAVLHYISPFDDVNGLISRYTSALAPDSLLVISHTTEDPRPEVAAAIRAVFDKTPTPVTHRSREEVIALFQGLELVEPGVVWTPQWRPDDPSEPLHDAPERSATFAGVARIPA